MLALVSLCAGIGLCAWLPVLPPWFLLPALWLMVWPCWWRRAGWRQALLYGCLGLSYASWRAEWRLAARPAAVAQGVSWQGQGVVRGLAERGEWATRVRFVPEAGTQPLPGPLLLQDYALRSWPAGSRWQLSLRLRLPHGAANVAGFDAERWFWSEGLLATANVGKQRSALPRQAADLRARLDAQREQLALRLSRAAGGGRDGALLAALAVGATPGLQREQWQALANTGLTHLISVSGLHIALVAGSVSAGCHLLRRRLRRLPTWLPRWLGVLAACGYAMLAGFAVPTQRTLWMLLVAALALSARRAFSPLQVWWLALATVLLIDPFAVLAIGFWLSFGLVGALIVAEQGLRQLAAGWRRLLQGQVTVTLASGLPLLYCFGQFPLQSPLANALGIPLVSCVLTPLALLAAVWPAPWLAALAGQLAHLFWWWVDTLAAWPPLPYPALPLALLPAALLGSVLALLPLGWAWRSWGLVLLLPVLLYRAPRPLPATLQVEIIDVGQGLAVRLQTAGHDALFDTGAGAAERVLSPVLRARGIRQLDVLWLSHHDQDHDGAAPGVLAQWPVGQLFRGQPASAAAWPGRPCRAGQRWVWDGVRFEVLWPPPGPQAEDNAYSCVLRVATRQHAILLSGDAPQPVERQLVARYGAGLRSQILVLGHHGSRTATAEAWLAAVQPQLAIASAGYRNRYRHPHPEVLARLSALAVPLWRTDRDGALLLTLGEPRLRWAPVRGWRPYWASR